MLLRAEQVSVAAADAAVAVSAEGDQLSIAAAIAAATGVEAAKPMRRTAFRSSGGIITWGTTPTFICAAPTGSGTSWGGASRWLRQVVELALSGVRAHRVGFR